MTMYQRFKNPNIDIIELLSNGKIMEALFVFKDPFRGKVVFKNEGVFEGSVDVGDMAKEKFFDLIDDLETAGFRYELKKPTRKANIINLKTELLPPEKHVYAIRALVEILYN